VTRLHQYPAWETAGQQGDGHKVTRSPKLPRRSQGGSPPAVPAVVILGANLREARQRARLSQVELAERAALAQQVISLIEVGRANPTVQTLQRLADALGYPLADLLKTG
jgi:ribosome-binding protein aMBF1 (putative translation factor)